MNRRSSLMALVAAGCGAGRTAPPREPEIAHQSTTSALVPAPDVDVEAGARMWRAIAPTGADFQDKLNSLPEELHRPMAIALLRQGDFACNAYSEQYGCSESYFELDPLDPAATLEDPCLRRNLALWSLTQLEPDDVVALGEVLVELVSMPSPEYELPEAAFALATDDTLRLRMLAAASEEFAEQHAGTFDTEEAKLHALVDLHLDNAVEGIDAAAHRDRLRPALLDDQLSAWTRVSLLDAFAEDDDKRTTRALVELTSASDCSLAMRAAEILAERGDPSYLPKRPHSRDPEEHLRALCMLGMGSTVDESPEWESWFAEDGYQSSSGSDYDTYYDEDGEQLEDEAETVAGGYDDRLVGDGWSCTDLTCTLDGGYREVTVTFAAVPDGLLVESIDSQEYGGCGC